MTFWTCSQIGAREHYAIPRALHGQERLYQLTTDIWCSSHSGNLARMLGKPGQRLADRFHPDLADAPVESLGLSGLLANYRAGRARSGNWYHEFIRQGKWFSKTFARQLKPISEPAIFFGYDTGFLEAALRARECGMKTIVGQVDPGRVETELVREESRWPGWSLSEPEIPEDYHDRRAREWEVADRILVNSDWVKSALVQQKVPPEKIDIVPLSIDTPITRRNPRKSRNTPLQVLWLGSVILRKGIQYALEAARLLREENVQVSVVGPIGISRDAIRSAPENMKFIGAVPRSTCHSWFQSADVFILPTLSDGFAITQLEAMAAGLPVIATPNCGRVVEDGVNGFQIPPRDSKSLAHAISRLANDSELLETMSAAALKRASHFSINQLKNNLLEMERKTMD